MISSAFRRRLAPGLFVCSAMLVLHTARGAEPALTVLAVIPAQRGAYQPSGAVVVELETALFQDKDFTMVDRQQVARVLAEHALAQSGLAQATNRLSIGRWLTADVLLFLDSQPAAQNAACQLLAVEARTGITLDSQVSEQQALLKDIPGAIAWLKRADAKRLIPLKDRHLLGVLGLHSEEGGHYLDTTVNGLSTLVTVGLGRMNDVALLEREHVEHLRTEKDLSSEDVEMRSSVLLLDGGAKRTPKPDELAVTLRLQGLGGGAALTTNVVVSSTNMPAAQAALLNALRPLLKLTGSAIAPTPDPKAEAAIFARQTELWSRWGDPEKALTAASAAYALDASQSNRFVLAMHMLDYLRNLYGREISEDLNGYRLYEEYVDTRLRDIKAGSDTNLTISMPPWSWKVSFPNPDPEPTHRMRLEIMDTEERVFRKILAHYRAHFDELWSSDTEQGNNPYWEVWANAVADISLRYYPWSTRKQVDFIREAAEAFANPPSIKPPRITYDRMRTILRTSLVRTQDPDDEKLFVAAMKELQKHKDPVVRIAAHKLLFSKYGAKEEERAAWEIVVNDLPPEHQHRSYWFAEKMLLQSFSKLGSEEVKDYGVDMYAKLIRQVLDSKQVSHIVAMSDVIPQWLDVMVGHGRIAEADGLAERTLAVANAEERRRSASIDTLARALGERRDKYAAVLHRSMAPSSNDPLWDEYDIEAIDLGFGFEERPPDAVFPDGSAVHCLYAWSDAVGVFNLRLLSRELPSGKIVASMKQEVPSASFYGASPPAVACFDRQALYLPTSEGVAVFQLKKGKAFLVTEKDGLPGKSVRCAACVDGKVYLVLGNPRFVLAQYDPASGRAIMLASETATEKRNSLDGLALEKVALVPDAKRACLWIAGSIFDRAVGSDVRHLWSYNPGTGTFAERPELVVGYALSNPNYQPMLGSALDRDYLIQWPNLVRIEDHACTPLPEKDRQSGAYFRGGSLIWEGDRLLVAGLMGEKRALCLLPAGGDTFVPLRQIADGKPFPAVRSIVKTSAGTLALCTDSAYLIERRGPQAAPPAP